MSVNNLLHELFHSFNIASGMGGMRPGSLFDKPGIIKKVMFDTEDDENSVPDLLEVRNGVERQNPSLDDTELHADLGMFYIHGLITDDDIKGLTDAYQFAIRQAMLYHTDPATYAERLGLGPEDEANLQVTIESHERLPILRYNTVGTGGLINGQIHLSDNNVLATANRGDEQRATYTLLARTASPVISYHPEEGEVRAFWVYVGAPVSQGYGYGWVRRDTLPVSDAVIMSLPIRTFENTDPTRPID
jgi:hypothetical protein